MQTRYSDDPKNLYHKQFEKDILKTELEELHASDEYIKASPIKRSEFDMALRLRKVLKLDKK